MSDRFGIDPLSQMIGTLSAQMSSLTAVVAEVRADVLQNRLKAEAHREREIKAWDQVEAEMRTVKHEHRGFEQKIVILENKISKMDRQLTAWQTRFAIFTSCAAALGGVVGFVVEAGIRAAFAHWVQ